MSDKTVALVTGGNKGIGLEVARQLGAEGITVLVGARDEGKGRGAVDALRSGGADAHFVALDVTDEGSIERARGFVERTFGKLDILINNAGVNIEDWNKPGSGTGVDVYRRTFEVNFFGLVAVTRAMLGLIKRSAAGRIVNVSSIAGSMTEHSDPKSTIHGFPAFAYNASKAAVNMYTVNLANELKDTKVKVNAAHPGWVKTDMGGDQAPLDVQEGAETEVWLATLPHEGPTGGLFHKRGRMGW